MTSDEAVRARVTGREAVADKTVWQLNAGPLRARCVHEGGPAYVVQGYTYKGWTAVIFRGTDPVELLRQVAGSIGVRKAIEGK
jgi:hypothetical protein